MNIKQVVGANLLEIRESRGFTQAYVADECGFEPPSYSRWESGKSWPSPDTIERLAAFYDVPETYFYRDEAARKVKPTLDEALRILSDETGILLTLPSSIKKNSIPADVRETAQNFPPGHEIWEGVRGLFDVELKEMNDKKASMEA